MLQSLGRADAEPVEGAVRVGRTRVHEPSRGVVGAPRAGLPSDGHRAAGAWACS
jgi:hypothetical protein